MFKEINRNIKRNKMKQTAVEWLQEKLATSQLEDMQKNINLWFEQAKEMEKQQIFDACYLGHLKGWVDDGVENSYAEQYYNETFSK